MKEMGFEVKEEEKWIQYYSSNHHILIVGDGDFSFSFSLACSFNSAFNILATSLDSYDVVVKKYKKAKSHLKHLRKLGASCLHDVNATTMKTHPQLRMRKFDRILFNFPHAGFGGREEDTRLIHKHRCLVHGFFFNARSMLRPNGEIHVNHKTTPPFSLWNLEELATHNLLSLIGCVKFNIKDYPGYKNKRGDGSRCDRSFPLGKCSTFKFRLSTSPNPVAATSRFDLSHKRFEKFYPSIDSDGVTLPASVGNGEDNVGSFPHLVGDTKEAQEIINHGTVTTINDEKIRIHTLLESNQRTCYDMSPSIKETIRCFLAEFGTMPTYQESNQRT